MRISVIITTYNRPDYLRRVLEGYRRQLMPPSELVVADDGSTEETAETVRFFAAEVPFPVRHAWQEDSGPRVSRVRNLASAVATLLYGAPVSFAASMDTKLVKTPARPGPSTPVMVM